MKPITLAVKHWALSVTIALALGAGCGGELEGNEQGDSPEDPTFQATNSANRRFYLHYDHQGTPIASTNTQGTRSCHQEFRPYGELQLSGGTCPQLKYTGMVFDEDTGLYYYKARYYDPKIGRFLSADSVRGTIGRPQSHNRYAYVQGNPYGYVDPSGHEPVPNSWLGMAPAVAPNGRGEMRATTVVDRLYNAILRVYGMSEPSLAEAAKASAKQAVAAGTGGVAARAVSRALSNAAGPVLYHGTNVSGIKTLLPGGVGGKAQRFSPSAASPTSAVRGEEGVVFATESYETAAGYAASRAADYGGKPVVYAVESAGFRPSYGYTGRQVPGRWEKTGAARVD